MVRVCQNDRNTAPRWEYELTAFAGSVPGYPQRAKRKAREKVLSDRRLTRRRRHSWLCVPNGLWGGNLRINREIHTNVIGRIIGEVRKDSGKELRRNLRTRIRVDERTEWLDWVWCVEPPDGNWDFRYAWCWRMLVELIWSHFWLLHNQS